MRKKAFTLIELLVVISIIALLLSIVVPGLRAAKESARRTICATHLKGLGQGVFVYANSNQERLPESYYKTGDPWYGTVSASYALFLLSSKDSLNLAAPPKERYINPVTHKKDVYGFGYLFETDIIAEGETFYCPAMLPPPEPSGQFGVSYRYEAYSNNGTTFPWNNDTSGWNETAVRSSYSYMPQHALDKKTINSKTRSGVSGRFPATATKVSQLNSSHVMACDVLFRFDFLPHRKGGGKNASGVNALYSDASVAFSNNSDAFDPQWWGTNPPGYTRIGTDEYVFRTIINMLK